LAPLTGTPGTRPAGVIPAWKNSSPCACPGTTCNCRSVAASAQCRRPVRLTSLSAHRSRRPDHRQQLARPCPGPPM